MPRDARFWLPIQRWPGPDPTPPAAFNPAAGFPWNGDDRQDLSLARTDYDPTEQAWAIGSPLNVVAQSAWTDPQADPAPPPQYDPSEQAWSVGPPQNAVLLSNWTVEDHFPDQSRRDYDPSEQSWPVGPPQNAVALTIWTGPQDEPGAAQTFDPTKQPWPIQPPVAAAFDPSTGFPWTTEQGDPTPPLTFDPTKQPWSVGPPQNADRLSAWTSPRDEPAVEAGIDSTDQAWAIQPTVFDPAAGFPWTIADRQQDQSLQPVWTDDQHGTLGLVPPTDQALLAGTWNLDAQQDQSTQPVWYDPSEQAWSIGPQGAVTATGAWVQDATWTALVSTPVSDLPPRHGPPLGAATVTQPAGRRRLRIVSRASFSQPTATWAATATVNDDELALAILLGVPQ